MNIIGIVPAIGGIGSTSLSLDLSKELENTLLIDFNNGFRTIDILIDKSDIIYDIYDFSEGLDKDLSIINTEDFDFIASSQSRELSDFNISSLEEKLRSLDYENIIVDLPRNTLYLKEIGKILDYLVIVSNSSAISKRNVEKIVFDSFKTNKKLKTGVFLNQISKLNVDEFKDFKDNLKLAKLINIVGYDNNFKDFKSKDLDNLVKFINKEDFELGNDYLELKGTNKENKNADSKTWFQKIFKKWF